VLSLVALVAQLRLATQQHLHPGAAQWPLRNSLDVRGHLWCTERRLRHVEHHHTRGYWRMHPHLWLPNRDLLALEAETCQTSALPRNGANEKWWGDWGEAPRLTARWRDGGLSLGFYVSMAYCTGPY